MPLYLRVSVAEDEESTALRDGRSLLLDAVVRQPLRTWPNRNLRELIVVVVIVTNWGYPGSKTKQCQGTEATAPKLGH